MLGQFLLALFSGAVSSALTLGVAYYLFRTRWRPGLEAEIAAREAELDAKLAAFGQRLEAHVRQGIVDGVAALPSSEVIREGTRSLAKTGVDLVSVGIDTLLGPRDRGR